MKVRKVVSPAQQDIKVLRCIERYERGERCDLIRVVRMLMNKVSWSARQVDESHYIDVRGRTVRS